MRTIGRLPYFSFASLGIVIALAGCVGRAEGRKPDVSPTVDRSGLVDADRAVEQSLALPLSGLLRRASAEDAAISQVLHRNIGTCMQERGFEYPYEFVADPSHSIRTVERPFGVWPADLIAGWTDGYAIGGTKSVSQWLDAYLETLQPSVVERWYVAYLGPDVPDETGQSVTLVDGSTIDPGLQQDSTACYFLGASDAFGENYAVYEAYRQSVDALADEAWSRTEADSRVVQALDDWSSCMESAGYGYDRPVDPLNEFAGPEIEEGELDVLQQDLACKQASDLSTTWFSIKLERERELIDDNPVLVAEFSRLRNAALQAAE